LDTIFCDEKQKKAKNMFLININKKLDFPFSEILAKTMRENSSPRISRVTVIQELETEPKKRALFFMIQSLIPSGHKCEEKNPPRNVY